MTVRDESPIGDELQEEKIDVDVDSKAAQSTDSTESVFVVLCQC